MRFFSVCNCVHEFLFVCACMCVQVYPGLMVTSGLIHYILNSLHFTVHIRNVCVFLAPTFRYMQACILAAVAVNSTRNCYFL